MSALLQNTSPWPRRRGATLVVVLVFIAFVSSLLSAASRIASSSALAATTFANAMRSDELGRAAVHLVARQVSSGDPEAKRGGAFVAYFADAKIAIDYVSETARVDINLAPPKFLGALFRAAGADTERAAEITDRIIAWRRLVAKAAVGPLEHVFAIADAWGVSQPLIEAVGPALTVASGSGKVDPLTADRLVVAALLGGEGFRVDEFLARRRRGFTSEAEALDAIAPDMLAFAGFSAAKAYRAVARVTVGGRFERRYEFVVAPPEAPDEPDRTIFWRISP